MKPLKTIASYSHSDEVPMDLHERINEPFILRDTTLLQAPPSFGDLEAKISHFKTELRRITDEKLIADFRAINIGVTGLGDALTLLQKMTSEKSKKTLHLDGINVLNGKVDYEAHVKTPSFLRSKKISSVIWFLGFNTRSPAHYHPCVEALLFQVIGQKEFILIPPEENHKLQMYPLLTGNFTRSRYNFYHSEMEETLKSIRHYRFTLAPGEAVFLPMHWVHVPYSSGLSLSQTFFWDAQLKNYKLRKESFSSLLVKYLYRNFAN